MLLDEIERQLQMALAQSQPAHTFKYWLHLHWSNVENIKNDFDHDQFSSCLTRRGYEELPSLDLVYYARYQKAAKQIKMEIYIRVSNAVRAKAGSAYEEAVTATPPEVQLVLVYTGHGRKRDPSQPYLEKYTPEDVIAEADAVGAQVLLGSTKRPSYPGMVSFYELAVELGDVNLDIIYVLNCCAAHQTFRGGEVSQGLLGACNGEQSLPSRGMAEFFADVLNDDLVLHLPEVCHWLLERYQQKGGEWAGLQPTAETYQGYNVRLAFTLDAAVPPPPALAAQPVVVMLRLHATLTNESAREFVGQFKELLAKYNTHAEVGLDGCWKAASTHFRFTLTGPAARVVASLQSLGFEEAFPIPV
eukprot:TRINITY_DN46334_c0_g1_i1.p1 TRINITY_DN46334_c0_g1~~TRINITY_DN46334_c0_g1_i1.p1  ORF type:complete len:360 (+),score=66.10 TRINITY_DN46334_c0_g1_i1:53-1132(+)